MLVVTLNAAGNWPPERELVRGLLEAGHDVRVLSDACHAGDVTRLGAEFRARRGPERVPGSSPGTSSEDEMARVTRDVFMNQVYADELLAEVRRERPDVVAIDQMLMMAIAAAETTGVATATLCHSVYGAAANHARFGSLVDHLNGYRARLGLEAVLTVPQLFESADAVLVFSYQRFDEPPAHAPRHLHYVGPLGCSGRQAPRYDPPWDVNDGLPVVLVSYSTSHQNQGVVLQRVADAVEHLDAHVLMTLGPAVSASELRLPNNVVTEAFVPHDAVLPKVDLVVTHAGHGTVMAAVTAGIPLVCTPMGRDQFLVAGRVETLGLGVALSPESSVEELQSTIATALGNRQQRSRSRAFTRGLNLGVRRAIDVLEAAAIGGDPNRPAASYSPGRSPMSAATRATSRTREALGDHERHGGVDVQ